MSTTKRILDMMMGELRAIFQPAARVDVVPVTSDLLPGMPDGS